MLKPRGESSLILDGRTCALGAALDAVGALPENNCQSAYNDLQARWPWLITAAVQSPFNSVVMQPAMWSIWDANDCYHWTREAIADWVATVEPCETTSEGISHTTNAVREAIESPVLSLRD